jgi:hypothetical protein
LAIPQADLPHLFARAPLSSSRRKISTKACRSTPLGVLRQVEPREAWMKHLIALALIAAAVTAVALSFTNYNTDPQSERSFEVAQRRCPNGRC